MTKMRVYELAKEMNTTSKRLMEKLAEINIKVKNHMSLLEEKELEALYDHIGVIKHKEESDEKKLLKSLYSSESIKEARKEVKKEKNAPRIIRKTEIILDSDDEQKDKKEDNINNSAKKNNKRNRSSKKRDFVKVATSNSGLRPGFVRDPKPELRKPLEAEKKQEVTKIVNSHDKSDTHKEVSKEQVKQTAENKNALPGNSDENRDQNAKVAQKPISSDAVDKDKDTKKQGVNETSKPKVSSHAKVESKNKADKVHDDRANNNKGNRTNNLRKSRNDNHSNDRKDNQQSNFKNRNVVDGKTGNKRPVHGDKQPYNQNNKKFNKSGQGQAGKPYNDKDKNRTGGTQNRSKFASNKPLDIPKVDPTAKKDEITSQRSEVRREFSSKDTAKDTKRELKKEVPKAGLSKGGYGKVNKKVKPNKNAFAGKKDVSQVLSDDFVLQEFYVDNVKKKKRPKKDVKKEEKYIPPRAVLTSIKIPEVLTVKELAESLKKTAAEIIKRLMKLGILATVNQEVDFDTAEIIADEFGVKAEKEIVVNEEDILFDDEEEEDEAKLEPRPPVVVVMGHVDHGKTSLLDAIKSSRVTEIEAGGITQHIGAYMVNLNERNITFLDTPGHEAFTAMRARGAQVTDVAILVVAADDGVMPQTIEAINHAKAANVTMIVAINKMDKPGANPDRVKQELTEHGLVPEDWGGDTICVEVSAKNRTNIDNLLEMVLLAADMLELKANPDKQAKGTVVEAKLDKDRGPTATILVQRGTLNTGDSIVTGTIVGRIRAMVNDKGQKISKAGPSTPVEILGLPEVPEAGEIFYAITDEKIAKQLVEKRKNKQREKNLKSSARVSLDDLFNQIKEGKVKDLNVIVKADVQGSVEAVKQSLEKLTNEEVRVRTVHGGVGAVTESDVTLAQVSNAIIIGFNVRPATNVAEIAKDAGVDLRLYRIIYNAIEDIQAAMNGMLEPTYQEVVTGHIETRQIFKVSGIGTIGGGYVLDGKITRNSDIRLVRDGIVVHEGKLASLKRFKDDVKEVAQGYECGFSVERFNDIKEGDVIEAFVMEEVKR